VIPARLLFRHLFTILSACLVAAAITAWVISHTRPCEFWYVSGHVKPPSETQDEIYLVNGRVEFVWYFVQRNLSGQTQDWKGRVWSSLPPPYAAWSYAPYVNLYPSAPHRAEIGFLGWRLQRVNAGIHVIRFTAPLIQLAIVFAIPAALLWLRKRLRKPPGDICPECHYDLRASPTRCPECGLVRTNLPSVHN
jgi:hypothetical protein